MPYRNNMKLVSAWHISGMYEIGPAAAHQSGKIIVFACKSSGVSNPLITAVF
ncbi:MAG TPA: hypothetical protein VHT96_15665 [Clostridia bacterium]|nr:hypothetical protein [Clostridia bacterium]